uniref:Uncharacterized protein n=1 Tax=Caenorhabditis tropicalis TaxID=1561998 RepID=A0A1I7ULG6_9PELO
MSISQKSSRTKEKKRSGRRQKKSNTKRRSKPRTKTKTGRRKSHTTSRSQTVTPTKETSADEKLKVKTLEDDLVKDPDSRDKKKKDAAKIKIPDQPPKKVEVKNHDPDEEKMKHLLKKLRKEKTAPKPPVLPLDEKSKLLMDRVIKKPYPMKYRKKATEQMLMDEKSSFFKVSIPSNPTTATTSKSQKTGGKKEEDTYADCPKLADVLKKPPGKSIYNEKGIPFWAEYIEPTEKDLIGTEEAITIGSDHIEALQKKETILKTIDEKVTMDSFQPLAELRKRDERHFHEHLVFSNTLRSVINVQNTLHETGSGAAKSADFEMKTGHAHRVQIAARSPQQYVYSRSDPFILTPAYKVTTPTTTTTTTTTTSGE